MNDAAPTPAPIPASSPAPPAPEAGDEDRITVGLLLCDHLDPDAAEVAGDYPELFPATYAPAGIDLRIYEATAGDLPRSVDECEAWMTSGSRFSAYEREEWILRLRAFLADVAAARRPQVGICFGHQLTALALGGDVRRAPVGWGVGVRDFELVGDAPWIDPTATGFRILMSHQDQVVRLPEGAELLATAGYCPIGAYRIGDHVFCVQGHPEFVPDLSEHLIRKRWDRIGPETAEAGVRSLEEPHDHDRIVDWIADFYRRSRDPAR